MTTRMLPARTCFQPSTRGDMLDLAKFLEFSRSSKTSFCSWKKPSLWTEARNRQRSSWVNARVSLPRRGMPDIVAHANLLAPRSEGPRPAPLILSVRSTYVRVQNCVRKLSLPVDQEDSAQRSQHDLARNRTPPNTRTRFHSRKSFPCSATQVAYSLTRLVVGREGWSGSSLRNFLVAKASVSPHSHLPHYPWCQASPTGETEIGRHSVHLHGLDHLHHRVSGPKPLTERIVYHITAFCSKVSHDFAIFAAIGELSTESHLAKLGHSQV
mmetsp:Transcript_15508/g.31361  ORF Transcript_15508/g.31361 Transcript_15508/m.31361 type:complete len:269 (-) Transcript_15508:1609-2415(-)